MEQNPIQNDARRKTREAQLGVNAHCCFCGETDIAVLRRGARSLLEVHHVVGKANDPEATVVFCFNCHRKQTERMHANGTSLSAPPTFLHRLVAILLGLAAFFQMLAEQLTKHAKQLVTEIAGLDRTAPDWRTTTEAA
jgi:hypothetical protein